MDPRTSAQDVMRCDLCETAVVQMHCDTCLTNLCKTCVGEHISTDDSKDHKVVKFQFRKSILLYPCCITHADTRCELYCKECDTPVCSACIASKKHKEHDIHMLKDILAWKKDLIQTEIKELEEVFSPTYLDIAADARNILSKLDTKYEDLSIAITKHREDWHRQIEKLVQNLKAEVDEMKNKHKETVNTHLSNVNTCISNINDDIESLHKLMDSNNVSEMLNFQVDSEKYRILPSKLNVSMAQFSPLPVHAVHKQISEVFGKLIPTKITADKHGYSIKTVRESLEAASSSLNKNLADTESSPAKQLLDEPEIVTTIMTTDTEYDELYDVVCLSDEKIWTRGDNGTMKLFSINQGLLLKSITTKCSGLLNDITVTNTGDLVYTEYNDRIANIMKNEEREVMIRVQNCSPRGVCSTSSGDLLFIMESNEDETKVVRYSGSTEKQTIYFDDEGKPLYSPGFRYIRHITENRNLDICVADGGAKAVVVVNQAGKLRFRYTGHTPTPKNRPFSPLGITTDSLSHILTADQYNDCVHIIDQDGHFHRYIDCGLIYPYGLCTDMKDNLFVAENKRKQVKKIKYLK